MVQGRDSLDWPIVAFGDVVKLNRDRIADPVAAGIERYLGIEHIEPEDLRIRRWGLVEEGTTFTNAFQPGQVLFVKRRAYQRKVAVADFAGVCSGDIYVLDTKDPDVLLPELLPFLCQTEGFFEHAVGTSAGSLSPRTNWTQLDTYEFALPPLAEQRRIAEVLSSIEALLESLKVLLDCVERLANSTVEDLLRPESMLAMSLLGDLADIRYGLTVNRNRRETRRKIPYLRVANVYRGQLDLGEVKDIGFLDGDDKYILQLKDILVVEGHANPEEIGRAALWNNDIEQCAHQNHLIRVRCKDGLDPEFLLIFLNSTLGRRYFLAHAKSTSGLSTINSTVVREIPVPNVELDQQKYIVTVVNEIRLTADITRRRYDSALLHKKHFLAELEHGQ